jgi:hypothetical protein
MKRKGILTSGIIAALLFSFFAPTLLLAEQAVGNSPDGSRQIEQWGNINQNPNDFEVQREVDQQGDFYVPDGVNPLDVIILPDWRGGDRVVLPILIKIIIKHKVSKFKASIR